ncbi:phosphoglycerate mutase [Luteibacter aegosomatis]|uniref:phosphoglycerate mutase n=1 Tax=Luteibacter aegosomatis TaxID=2911537 RepID=UPI001FFB85BD|nr:phosphoglycerate mutase [Luteibacter aegosomatis]UPG84585.1 phosphoglycerate mutase [Luteibacter aegosomatis]
MTRVLNLLLPGRDKLAVVADFAGWIARGTELPVARPGYLHALAEHFRWPGGPLPAAALIRQAVAGDAGDVLWVCADPAWVQPELNGARLLGCGNLAVSADDATAMVSALRDTFDEQGMSLLVGDPQHWQLRVPGNLPVPAFPDPEEALGADLFEQLPQGEEGRRWRALLNEAQVVLHHLPQNAERMRDGLPPVNSVWLWGAGAMPEWVECGQGRIYSDDLLVWALGQKAGVDVQPRPVARGVPTDGVGAADVPFTLLDLQDVQPTAFDRDWWPWLRGRLESGDELRLSFADGRRMVLRKRHRLRFWRKP